MSALAPWRCGSSRWARLAGRQRSACATHTAAGPPQQGARPQAHGLWLAQRKRSRRPCWGLPRCPLPLVANSNNLAGQAGRSVSRPGPACCTAASRRRSMGPGGSGLFLRFVPNLHCPCQMPVQGRWGPSLARPSAHDIPSRLQHAPAGAQNGARGRHAQLCPDLLVACSAPALPHPWLCALGRTRGGAAAADGGWFGVFDGSLSGAGWMGGCVLDGFGAFLVSGRAKEDVHYRSAHQRPVCCARVPIPSRYKPLVGRLRRAPRHPLILSRRSVPVDCTVRQG